MNLLPYSSLTQLPNLLQNEMQTTITYINKYIKYHYNIHNYQYIFIIIINIIIIYFTT
jgi:hypothetical protein